MPLHVERRRRVIAPTISKRRSTLTAVAIAVVFFSTEQLGRIPRPFHTSSLTGALWLDELLCGHPDRIHQQLGMSAMMFLLLAAELVQLGGLENSKWVSAQEKLAIFVYWLVHGSSQRELCERFQRSGSTISIYLNQLLELFTDDFYDKYVHDPPNVCPDKIKSNPKWYPYFRLCRGATDGVHVPAHCSADDIPRYRDRKGNVTQNVLATCDFDLVFVHVMAGYEGTAADGQLYDRARVDGFSLPGRCFFLGDAGFASCDLIMPPYRGVRYHLKEWKRGKQRPQNAEELFNLRHAQLRSAIERGFGVTKRRFKLLISRPEVGYRQQALMVHAACAVHNFLRLHEPINELEEDEEYDVEGHGYLRAALEEQEERAVLPPTNNAEKARADARRDHIAAAMWADYIIEHPDLA
ncbi:putative nuclease HARBI1-like protein [Mycena kentingensis (nom. inval.)]|nr:putative nuclease HARBI1-like protein [Mycena kentingensis (nom. inval.)]